MFPSRRIVYISILLSIVFSVPFLGLGGGSIPPPVPIQDGSAFNIFCGASPCVIINPFSGTTLKNDLLIVYSVSSVGQTVSLSSSLPVTTWNQRSVVTGSSPNRVLTEWFSYPNSSFTSASAITASDVSDTILAIMGFAISGNTVFDNTAGPITAIGTGVPTVTSKSNALNEMMIGAVSINSGLITAGTGFTIITPNLANKQVETGLFSVPLNPISIAFGNVGSASWAVIGDGVVSSETTTPPTSCPLSPSPSPCWAKIQTGAGTCTIAALSSSCTVVQTFTTPYTGSATSIKVFPYFTTTDCCGSVSSTTFSEPGGSFTVPSLETEVNANQRFLIVTMAGLALCFLEGNVITPGPAGSKMRPQYSPDQITWTDFSFQDMPISSTGFVTSSLVQGSILGITGTQYIRIMALNGDDITIANVANLQLACTTGSNGVFATPSSITLTGFSLTIYRTAPVQFALPKTANWWSAILA